MGWLWDGYSVHGRARQRNELLHSIRPPAPTSQSHGCGQASPVAQGIGIGAERRDHDGDDDGPSQQLQRHPCRTRRTARSRPGLPLAGMSIRLRPAVYGDIELRI
jgi:hypothetical protein